MKILLFLFSLILLQCPSSNFTMDETNPIQIKNESDTLFGYAEGTDSTFVRAISNITFNLNNQVLVQSHYSADGKLASKRINHFDEHNIFLKSVKVDSNDIEIEETIYTFDKQNPDYVLKIENYAKNSLTQSINYTYDYDSICTMRIENGEAKLQNESQFILDSANQIIVQYQYLPTINLHSRYYYQYDTIGNVIEEIYTDGIGFIIDTTVYSYTFDQHNNWTSKKKITSGEPISLNRRTIEYFK